MKPRPKYLLIVIVVWFFWAHAAASHAAPMPTAAGDIPLAEAFWGGPPPGCSSVAFGTTPRVDASGEATLPLDGAAPGPCVLEAHEVEAGTGYTPEFVCETVVHEEGHLHGFEHSTDPNSIMWGGELAPAAVTAPVCVDPATEALNAVTSEEIARHQAWEYWKESRYACLASHGPYRPRCWRALRRQAHRLRAIYS